MNVTASVQVKRNKYYIVVNWKTLDGDRKQKWVSTGLNVDGNNKRKAKEKCIEVLQEYKEKIAFNDNDMLFSEFLKDWLETTKHNISTNTYYSYRQTIYNSICPYFDARKIKLCDLKPYHLQRFYNDKIEKDGVSANTVHHYHANIHKALNFAVKTERIKSNPADKKVDLPKKEKHIGQFYTADETIALLDKAKGSNLETVIMLAVWLGLRRGEIIGLKWDCIDFGNNTLSIRGTIKDKGETTRVKDMRFEATAKTSSSLRTLKMPDPLAAHLLEVKNKQTFNKSTAQNYNHKWDDFVCVRNNGDIIALEYVSAQFPKLLKQWGLRRIKFHELRHTNISLLLESGVDMKFLQEWAGHSNYGTTANIYAHIQTKNKEALANRLSEILVRNPLE